MVKRGIIFVEGVESMKKLRIINIFFALVFSVYFLYIIFTNADITPARIILIHIKEFIIGLFTIITLSIIDIIKM